MTDAVALFGLRAFMRFWYARVAGTTGSMSVVLTRWPITRRVSRVILR